MKNPGQFFFFTFLKHFWCFSVKYWKIYKMDQADTFSWQNWRFWHIIISAYFDKVWQNISAYFNTQWDGVFLLILTQCDWVSLFILTQCDWVSLLILTHNATEYLCLFWHTMWLSIFIYFDTQCDAYLSSWGKGWV